MAKSYLIYEKKTIYELPVALCESVNEVARFLGVSRVSASRFVNGKTANPYYGVFVDDENEGQCTATTAPCEQRTEEV